MGIAEYQLRSEIRYIVGLLVNKDFQSIQEQNLLPFGDISVLVERIQEYSGSITMPPNEAFESFDFIEFKVTEDNFFFQADFNLWFNDQESDLTAQFVPSVNQANTAICLYDLHIL